MPGPTSGLIAFEKRPDVGVNRDMSVLVLVDLRSVDLHVDDASVLGELGELSGDAVIEADSQGQQEVRIVHGVVGVDGAVHAQHVERKVMIAGNRSQAVHGHRHGNARLGGELAQLFMGIRGQHPPSAVDDGPLAARDGRDDLADRLRRRRRRQVVPGQVHRHIVIRVGYQGVLNVLGDIDQDRAGPAGIGDMKCFLHHPCNVPGTLHQVVMLGDRAADFGHWRFLKGISANDVAGNLPRDRDQGNRVEFSVRQPGDQIERAGPGGGHDHAGLSRDSRVTFGREDPALLVPRQDGPDPVPESCQGLVHGHAGPAGVGKDDFDSVPYQRFDQNVGSGCRSRSDLSLAIVDGGHGPRFPLQVHC